MATEVRAFKSDTDDSHHTTLDQAVEHDLGRLCADDDFDSSVLIYRAAEIMWWLYQHTGSTIAVREAVNRIQRDQQKTAP